MLRWSPHVTVAAVVECEGRYLLVEEHTDEGLRLNQPAGHLEAGESLLEACVREAWEESAHRIELLALLGVYQWTRPQRDITYLRFAFRARSLSHEAARALDAGIERVCWMSFAELEACQAWHRSPLVLQCVADHRAGRSMPLDWLRHLD